MIEIIIAVLGVFAVQTLIAPAIQYFGADGPLSSRLLVALGPRDMPPAKPAIAGRAERALKNMMEALPIFLTLAILAIIVNKADGVALTGAVLFLAARIAYVPAYMSGIVGVRSLCWMAGAAGLVMMVAGLVG